MRLGDEERAESVFLQLRERYAEARAMRERSQRFVVWLSGMSFGLASVLLLRTPDLSVAERWWLTALVLAIGGAAVWHILAMWRGFRGNLALRITLEEVVEAYSPDVYVEGKPLLPLEYRSVPRLFSLRGVSQHFLVMLAWLVIVLVILLGLIHGGSHTPAPGEPYTESGMTTSLQIVVNPDLERGAHG